MHTGTPCTVHTAKIMRTSLSVSQMGNLQICFKGDHPESLISLKKY